MVARPQQPVNLKIIAMVNRISRPHRPQTALLKKWLPLVQRPIETLSALGRGRYCLLCESAYQASSHAPEGLCEGCLHDLPWNLLPCERCGLPHQAPLCLDCSRQPPPQMQTIAPLCYGFPVDHLIAGLKYHGHLANAGGLSQLLLNAVQHRQTPLPECLIPIPLHRSRLAKRGYNQALEIARPLARTLSIPMEIHWLERQRATAPQMQLTARAREKNPQDAFALTRKRHTAQPDYRHVALIDDVMTTGATLHDAARCLRAAGVMHIEYWVIARTRR